MDENINKMKTEDIIPATVDEANNSFWKNCNEDFKLNSRFYRKTSYILIDNSENSNLLFNELINFVLQNKTS